jgi:GAF domain-containing protein
VAEPAPVREAVDASLLELAAMVLSDTTTHGLLIAVTLLARRTLPACLAASITLVRSGRPASHVSSGEVAGDADSWQYEAGDGPCLAAIRDAATLRVDSFGDELRWPAFAARAVRCGIRSSLSIPLVVHDEVVGALSLYGGDEASFAGNEAGAYRFATQAAVTLANATALHDAEDLAGQLATALEHRDVIGQAMGILMATEQVSADEARTILRRASNRTNRKVSTIAGEIVAHCGRRAG